MSLPKNIFLVWFGDQKPAYVDFAVNSYKDMNPDFNVQLIHKTVQQIIDPDDSILARCKQMIFDALLEGNDNFYSGNIKFLYENRLNFLQILSDIYRFELIREKGGIYVDCDTVPIAPFDDSYLEDNGFCNVVIVFRDNSKACHVKKLKDVRFDMFGIDFMQRICECCTYTYTDKYAFGLPKDFTWQVDFSRSCVFKNTTKIYWLLNLNNLPLVVECGQKFFDGSMKDSDVRRLLRFHGFTPLVHFRENTWRKGDVKQNKLYIPELDDMIYPDN